MTTKTTKESAELSTFELDVYWASGRAPDAAIELHLAGCARCQGYLASLDASKAALPPPPAVIAAPPVARRRSWTRWALPAAGALALAAGVLFMVRSKMTDPSYVAVKGAPGVQLLVHRGGETRIWDGHAPVLPGDTLALRVACEGLARVAVAAPAPTEWQRLQPSSACPAEGETLPFTLVVDGEPGDEKLAVVLSREELDEATLRRAIAADERTSDVWVVQLELPKAVER